MVSKLRKHKLAIPVLLCIACVVGVGFASLIEMSSISFWMLYAVLGTALAWGIIKYFVSSEINRKVLWWGGIALVLSMMLLPKVPRNSLFTDATESSVSITALGEKNEKSNSNEVWINEILVDGKPIDPSEISLSEGWILQDNGSILAAPNDGNPSVPLVINYYGKRIQLQVVVHAWSGKAAIQIQDKDVTVVDLYDPNGSQKMFELSLENDRVLRFCEVIFIWVLIWSALIALLNYPMLAYILVCICLWLTLDEIKPAGSSHMVIGAISALAYLYAQRARHRQSMERYFHGRLQLAMIVVSMVASFCLFGYRLFLKGDFVGLSFQSVSYYLMGSVWIYPIVVSCLYGLECIRDRSLKKARENNAHSEKETWRVWCVATICFMGVMLLSWAAYYPGGFPDDAIVQFSEAEHGHYNAWHSVFHTLIIELVLSVWDNEAAVVLFQMLLFALLVGKGAVLAYECGINERRIYLAVVVFGLLPNQFTTVITPLKDFMFTYALLWLTMLLIDLVKNIEYIKKPLYIVKLSISLFFTYALRHNGVIPFLFVIIFLVIITIKFRKQIKLYACASIILACTLIGVYNGPLFSALNVIPNAVTPYVTMFCAVGSCLNKGLLLSEETMEKLEKVMPLKDWQDYYSRFMGHDLYMFEREGGMDLTGFSASEAFSIYLEALIRYPDVVIKDRLDGTNLLWDITMPDESFLVKTFDFVAVSEVADIEVEGYENGEVYVNRSVLAETYRKLREFAFEGEREIDQISNLLLWRTGIYLVFMMILMIFWNKNDLNRLWWAALPLIGNTAGLMLVLYHQSYRYVFYVQLLTIILALATFSVVHGNVCGLNEGRIENE